jgi:cell shape-determining protein MreC
MLGFLSKYKTIILLVCLCAISLILSWFTVGTTHTIEARSGSLKHRFSAFLAPVHYSSSVISFISSKIEYVGSIFVSIFRKPVQKERILELESKVEDLKRQLDEQIHRNRRLEEQYEVYTILTQVGTRTPLGPEIPKAPAPAVENPEPETAFRLLLAKVIAVEPTDWFRYLTIDKGTKHGVRVDMGVITRSDFISDLPHLTGAVVGRVMEANRNSAKIQLITDRLSVVAVTIESLGDLVLLTGQPETENCSIDEIPSTAYDKLKIGDAIIVDERSSIFPPGMLIGKLSSIEKGTHFCSIDVQPAFRFRKLREVMVVLGTR